MAISGADWASATDPFLLALDHAHTLVTGDISNNRVILSNSEGYISGIVSDRDIQELYWSKDSDPEVTWFVNALDTQGIGPHSALHELGRYQDVAGGATSSFRSTDYIEADPKPLHVYTTGKSGGAVLYSLFAFSAYSWLQKDPAQLLFSWITHYTNSAFMLKDFLNQASFQDASDYYDENPILLTLWREAGATISDQIKKVMKHTADFLAIRPADADGKLQLHIMPRLSGLTSRDTPIDLDSKSVKSYLIRPTDRYTLDRIDVSYGDAFFIEGTGNPDSPDDYDFTNPPDLPGQARAKLIQKVGVVSEDRSLNIDMLYQSTRGGVVNHLDIGYWKDDQDELELEFTDWAHLNFDIGDLVPVAGGGAGYSNEMFLCTEKELDIDSLTATARFIQLKGIAGKRPRYVDEANLLLSVTPNVLGDYLDGTDTFPKDMFLEKDPRNIDRLWDISDKYAHIKEMPRGAPAAANLKVDLDVRHRWPAITNDGTMGGDFPVTANDSNALSTAAASNFTMYCVYNLTDTVATSIIFSQASPVLTLFAARAGQVEYNDGLPKGSGAAITGWQIVTFILDSAGATIRRNGVDLDTGLAYTKKQFLATSDQSFLVSSGGDLSHFHGEFAEFHIFESAHSSPMVLEIEAHLAEKYNIPI